MDLATPFINQEQLTGLHHIGDGLEFVVFKASSPRYGRVAIRVPREKVFRNANDPNNNARDLINQELKIYELLQGGHVPVPKAFTESFLEIDGYPAMLSEFVPDDCSEVQAEELGRLAARIHSTSLPPDLGVKLVAMEGRTDALSTLVQRMLRRLDRLVQEEPSARSWALLTSKKLEPIADKLRHRNMPTCLLHMDLRNVNLRVWNGEVRAVIDWTNALFGPAIVEYYRIMELTRPGDSFVKGYSSISELYGITLEEEIFLRLDAALMLALVFISEAPDPERREGCISRVEELCRTLWYS